MKGVAERTPELLNEFHKEQYVKSYQSFQHFLVVKIEELEDEIKKIEINTDAYADKNEALNGFVAIILCWKPEWAQTPYFQKLSEGLRNDLVELAKSTKHEGSGGIDDKWLEALLKGEKEQTNA